MLKLFIEKKEIQDSVLPIRWSIDKETVEKILGTEIAEPLLLYSDARRKRYRTSRGGAFESNDALPSVAKFR